MYSLLTCQKVPPCCCFLGFVGDVESFPSPTKKRHPDPDLCRCFVYKLLVKFGPSTENPVYPGTVGQLRPGWWFHFFKNLGKWSHFDDHIFQIGWETNHQLDMKKKNALSKPALLDELFFSLPDLRHIETSRQANWTRLFFELRSW